MAYRWPSIVQVFGNLTTPAPNLPYPAQLITCDWLVLSDWGSEVFWCLLVPFFFWHNAYSEALTNKHQMNKISRVLVKTVCPNDTFVVWNQYSTGETLSLVLPNWWSITKLAVENLISPSLFHVLKHLSGFCVCVLVWKKEKKQKNTTSNDVFIRRPKEYKTWLNF